MVEALEKLHGKSRILFLIGGIFDAPLKIRLLEKQRENQGPAVQSYKSRGGNAQKNQEKLYLFKTFYY